MWLAVTHLCVSLPWSSNRPEELQGCTAAKSWFRLICRMTERSLSDLVAAESPGLCETVRDLGGLGSYIQTGRGEGCYETALKGLTAQPKNALG